MTGASTISPVEGNKAAVTAGGEDPICPGDLRLGGREAPARRRDLGGVDQQLAFQSEACSVSGVGLDFVLVADRPGDAINRWMLPCHSGRDNQLCASEKQGFAGVVTSDVGSKIDRAEGNPVCSAGDLFGVSKSDCRFNQGNDRRFRIKVGANRLNVIGRFGLRQHDSGNPARVQQTEGGFQIIRMPWRADAVDADKNGRGSGRWGNQFCAQTGAYRGFSVWRDSIFKIDDHRIRS